METELLPVVDLRSLSESDLDALAAASAHALAPRSCPDADPLPPLKIDRAVFNESAGSRKQTFSRHRLAAASSSPTARPAPTSSAAPSTSRYDPESSLVAYHIRRLFVPDDPSLPPLPDTQTLALTEGSPSPPPDPDKETTNYKGISVDLVRLAGMVDPYDAELQRRTAGMASETELMGFIASLAGKWVSARQRRKFVDASFFGDHLPRGWKLQLGLKQKEHRKWVHCFSYVSPKGSQFATCKEVSAYLMSLLGYPDAKTVTTQFNSVGNSDLCADNGRDDVIGFQHRIGSSVDNPNVLPVTSVTDERNVDTVNAYECQEHNLLFQDQISYSQHNFSSHEVTAKRCRTGNFLLDGFSRPNEACHRPEEIPRIPYAPNPYNVAVAKVNSNSNGQPDGSRNGSEVAVYKDQASNHNVFRPSTFGCSNPYEDQINDHGVGTKHGRVNNTVTARDANLNSCLGTSYLPNASASNETSTALYSASTNKSEMPFDVANRSPVSASTCFTASYGNNIGGGKANFIGNKNNRDQSNMGTRPVSSMGTEASFSSQSVHPQHSDKRHASNTNEQLDNMKNRTCKDTGFGTETYNNNNMRGFAQFSTSNFTQRKFSVSSHCSLPESSLVKASNLTKGTDVIMNGPGHVAVAVSAGLNVSDPMSMQCNSRSSMVCSVGEAPVSKTTQDQCDLQLGFGGQKQQLLSSYGELRSTTSGPPQRGMPRDTSVPTGPSQFGSMAGSNPFSSGASQIGSIARPDVVPTSFQFGIMARPNSVPPAESSQFGSVSRPSSSHAKSKQLGLTSPPDSSQFGSIARPNCAPPPDSSRFGGMASPNSVPHAKFSQSGSMARPNYVSPANSSQFGNTARSSLFPPAEATEFGNMTRQNFVSRTEPTLVLGYAPQMVNGPPVQVEWDMSSSRVTGGMMTCVCIWCNSQFHHFGPPDVQQTGSFGFICPACKEKLSGHPNMRNNGSWQA